MFLAAGDTSFLDFASRGGVIGLLVIILYGGFKDKPWWVFGWVHRDLQERYDRRGEQLDKWWEMARKAVGLSEVLAGITDKDDDNKGEQP